jgi:hypothetical protein
MRLVSTFFVRQGCYGQLSYNGRSDIQNNDTRHNDIKLNYIQHNK